MSQDSKTYAYKLRLSDYLREPVIREAIEALDLPSGSRGLDAGCGIGSNTMLLSEVIGSEGRVTGVDTSSVFLNYATEFVRSMGLTEQIQFQKGDVTELPFENNTFDWVWSCDCVGYPAMGEQSLIKELARITKPGGKIAILGWTSQQLLPGYPQLEARLNAPCSAIAALIKGRNPQQQFVRGLEWFDEAGVHDATARTFVGNVQAPLNDGTKRALVSLFEMLWDCAKPDVAPKDWAEYERLCRKESPDFILSNAYYHAFFTYTMIEGEIGGKVGNSG